MSKTIGTKILLRRDTQNNWIANNPILASGEIGFDITTGKHKIGDGAKRWSELPYFVNQEDLENRIKYYEGNTAWWSTQTSLVSEKNAVYIYSDYREEQQQDGSFKTVPGVKIGDGLAYVVDLPFIDNTEDLNRHIQDTDIHITADERLFWNNKVRCYVSDIENDNIIFTTN